MIAIRSFIFLIVFYLFNAVMCILWLPTLIMPRHAFRWGARVWLGSVLWLTKYVAGIDYRIKGQENIPQGSFIVASKHQSAWETFAMFILHHDCAYVLKKELTRIPLFGLYLKKMNCVAVDRKAGASALKDMVAQSQVVIDQERPLVIFPQGTRTEPGADKPYHPGIAGLYGEVDLPVLPVALNSGQFWGKDAFRKTPGVITVEYLEPIPAGLGRRELLRTLKQRIDTANTRIEAEAKEEFNL